ncbi:hypothetical protein C8R46DRAFT_912225 [Mycena filopes]|nr:hypothetical protein C8R46DRAFT_912225 [Mycena filopes]
MQGDTFQYRIGASTVTYGLIVALAGDFYGNYTHLVGDVEQISDKWVSNPESSIALGVKLAETLSNDTEKYLAYVLQTMKKEEDEVRTRIAKGEDVAQVYASFGDRYDKEYNSDTRPVYSPIGAYAWIALCNWDHFGQDAYNAYSAVHTAALRKAKEAHDAGPSQADRILAEAYFLEAYAQHFLTDLFSSGHLRTPRRVLHRNLLGDDPEEGIEPYPADRCAQMMHDEDCANGLWVRNARGDAWATYGDKQLWSGKSNQNMRQAVKAAQAGVDEVRNTRDIGVIPAAKDFAALQLVRQP